MTTPAAFAVKMSRAAAEFRSVDRSVANAAALHVKRHVQATLAVAAPRGRLNVGKRGARIGVRYTLYPSSARVFMFGPAHLIERDTAPHKIPRPKGGRGNKPIFIPGIGVRHQVNHPGTKGKHPWRKGLIAALRTIDRPVSDAYAAPVRRLFRG